MRVTIHVLCVCDNVCMCVYNYSLHEIVYFCPYLKIVLYSSHTACVLQIIHACDCYHIIVATIIM